MFGLSIRFLTGRYHATPWGRNVNEADVAWPPEPLRVLRALIACYWRKGDRQRWSQQDLAQLINALASDLPVFYLPEGSVHGHTRHYMPVKSGKSETKSLIFDSFLHLPHGKEIHILWPELKLEKHFLALASDLASSLGYFGRAESWADCWVITESTAEPNCGPAEDGYSGEELSLLVARSQESYQAERQRLIVQEKQRIQAEASRPHSELRLERKAAKSFRSRNGVDTLPVSLVDALSVDTADLRNIRWNSPPAAVEVIYARDSLTRPRTVTPGKRWKGRSDKLTDQPTIARYVLAGHPRPRIEDAIKIGEVMRAAAMSQFGWSEGEGTGARTPLAPWQISGRNGARGPVNDPTHPHAFWLPEDADDDGWIDHIIVYVSGGINREIQDRLDRITRIWLSSQRGRGELRNASKVQEWRLALEGFGQLKDFEGSSRLLAVSKRWRSVTPFLAAGYLKRKGYRGEVIRLLRLRGIDTEGVRITELDEISVGSVRRHALHFHRFRSRGREVQRDSSGALLEIEFPQEVKGPLAIGYGCHFGLGVFGACGAD
ncbi:MAG: type I-U CRISPR-associated protein Csb2 [Bacteroidota bacterium]|nr:type I-U CRISPR-associated protein Csb2 [Bacteroidota bacterium]